MAKDWKKEIARDSIFYKHNLYTIFAILLWIIIIVSSHYLKVKKSVIIKGMVLGVVSALIAYLLFPV